jgi:hypothetical protein
MYSKIFLLQQKWLQKWFVSGSVIKIPVCTRFNFQTTFVWVYQIDADAMPMP